MKEFPTAIEHEKRLLAAMMLEGGKIVPEVTAQLRAEEFYRVEHKIIFKAIVDRYNATNEPLNEFLVLDEIERTTKKIDRVYVLSLAEYEFTTARYKSYIKRIKETAQLRRLIDVSESVLEAAYSQTPAAEIRNMIEGLLSEGEDQPITTLESAGSIATDVLIRAFEVSKTSELTGVTTGLEDLDKVTNGLQKSDLIFLAARPSMGKTALALNIACNAALRGKKVALFSLEMSKAQIGARLISSLSEVPLSKITSGRFSDEEQSAMTNSVDYMQKMPLWIDETSCLSVGALRGKARQFQHRNGLDLIVIDYIQLMTGDRANANRVQEVSEISRNLKSMAKVLNVPVLVLSQLSRQVEMRADKRPQLSDLRESGSLEQDADIVMFLYRDEYYNREESEMPDVAELIIAKNRNGATATIRLHFDRDIVLFSDLTNMEL